MTDPAHYPLPRRSSAAPLRPGGDHPPRRDRSSSTPPRSCSPVGTEILELRSTGKETRPSHRCVPGIATTEAFAIGSSLTIALPDDRPAARSSRPSNAEQVRAHGIHHAAARPHSTKSTSSSPAPDRRSQPNPKFERNLTMSATAVRTGGLALRSPARNVDPSALIDTSGGGAPCVRRMTRPQPRQTPFPC